MSGEDDKYNEWNNYPTWAVALWVNNEEGWQTDAVQKAEEAWQDAEESPPDYEGQDRRSRARVALAETLEEWGADEYGLGLAQLNGAGPAQDLLGWAVCRVDWHEIADSFLEEVSE